MAKCIAPIKLANRDKTSPLGWDVVPCGKCEPCLNRRISSWAFRLSQQNKISNNAHFITFTYAHPPLSNNALPTLKKRDFQNFLKRLRKILPTEPYIKKNGKTGHRTTLKYYCCGEYGTRTQRPHYHAIMFNIPINILPELTNLWGHGHIQIDPCNMATISYTIGYLKKPFTRLKSTTINNLTIHDDRERHFSNMSKNLGINYINRQTIKYHKSRLEAFARQPSGQIIPLPRYYRDKIFTDDEKLLINQAIHEANKEDFEKLFNSNYNTKLQWTENKRRQQAKKQRLERNLI